jgi:uncharacterized protein
VKRAALIATVVGAFLIFAACAAVGEILSRPVRTAIGAPPPDLHAQSVSLRTSRGPLVAGWMVAGQPGQGAILLLHGVRSDRRQMIGRARFLNRLGYSVLLIDLPSHGQSEGDRITFGAREAAGVETALAYLASSKPNEPTGVIGVSLGAAAAVLANPARQPDVMVLESMYPTIEEATSTRLQHYLGPLGRVFTPVLTVQLSIRAGISAEELRPIAAIKRLSSPILIASGSIDHDTTLPQTLRIFNAANSPKELWVVEGADHVDLHRYSPETYEARITAFFADYMRTQSSDRQRVDLAATGTRLPALGHWLAPALGAPGMSDLTPAARL